MQVGSLTSRALCISLCQGYACERLQGICLPGPGANRGFFADGLLAGHLQVESLKRGGDGQSLVAQRLAEESAANAKRVEQVGPAPHESGGGAPALRAAKSPPPTTATADPNPESRGGRPRVTRRRICEDLRILDSMALENPWRKHGNIPL